MLDDFKPSNRPAPARLRDSSDLQKHDQLESSDASPMTTAPNIPVAAAPPEPVDDSPPEPPQLPQSDGKKRINWRRFIHKPIGKKQWAITIALFTFLISGSVAAYFLTRPQPAPAPAIQIEPPPAPPPKPTTEPSRLTGLPVKLALNKRPVTGVMIENSPDARPQAGLKEAGVVFEAVAEGGITRFLALYQESQPGNLGPVRSVRPYFLDFLRPFDAGIAHVGGSPEALAQIRTDKIKDLDQFGNPGSYARTPQRFAPHNMYTNMPALDALNKAKGYTSSKFTGFPRKSDAPAKKPSARGIDVNISSFLYNVHYDYDAKSNSYKRSMAGRPHIDANTNSQISPKVVLVLVMPRSIHPDGVHTVYPTAGKDKLYVFQDGVLQEGTWSKAGRASQFVFKDAKGKPFKFNAGQTWLTMINPGTIGATP
jgi:hypothetical protein